MSGFVSNCLIIKTIGTKAQIFCWNKCNGYNNYATYCCSRLNKSGIFVKIHKDAVAIKNDSKCLVV